MRKIGFWIFLIIVFVGEAWAHDGHTHGSSPAVSASLSSLDLASSIQSPLTMSLKARAGFVDGQFYSLGPGLFSYFGDDQLSATLSYEFQYREYVPTSDQNRKDYENSHRAKVSLTKAITEGYQFIVTGEGEQNRASTTEREVNNFHSVEISGVLVKSFSEQVFASLGYQFGRKSYPQGTYSIPSAPRTNVGESISPSENSPPVDEIEKRGVEDAEHGLTAVGSMGLGPRTLSLEAGYKLHFSNVKTRQFTGQILRGSMDSPLWKRATLFLSQGVEFRRYEFERQEIQISELNLLQEITSKIFATGTARYSQVSLMSARNWWEGYVQLQTIF